MTKQEVEAIIKKIKQLEPLNNADCPEWVINVIKGEANERHLDNSDRMRNSDNSFSDRKEEMTSEEARWLLIAMLQPRNNGRQNAAILKAIEALDIETALGTVVEHWRGNER